jgi:hypothetical protein
LSCPLWSSFDDQDQARRAAAGGHCHDRRFLGPAHAAGKAERARQAIAAAQAKIDTAEQLGTAEFRPAKPPRPRLPAGPCPGKPFGRAQAEAIDDAIQPSPPIGMMQKHKAEMADRQSAAAVADAQAQARRPSNRLTLPTPALMWQRPLRNPRLPMPPPRARPLPWR